MSKIRIKNFGPIKEGYQENDGWIDIKKVTVFIGDQGSGKSTVAKLVSTFMWMEKALNRGDGQFKTGADLIKQVAWQGLEDYFNKNSEIEYKGDRCKISYLPKEQPYPLIELYPDPQYVVPKVMYVPAERNFLSTIKDAFDVSGLPGPLASFAEELKRAQIALNGAMVELPVPQFSYEYDEEYDKSYVIGEEYKLNLLNASSGLQSLIPLYLVSRNLTIQIDWSSEPLYPPISANLSVRRDREISAIMSQKDISSEEKNIQTEKIFAKYQSRCFINIVEEPEQNLFPASQRSALNSVVFFNNMERANKLLMTTHSPYLLNYITLAVKANELFKLVSYNGEIVKEISQIVPLNSDIDPIGLLVYEFDGVGNIIKLDTYNGIPSDENYLNNEMGEVNELFARLLEIQQKL